MTNLKNFIADEIMNLLHLTTNQMSLIIVNLKFNAKVIMKFYYITFIIDFINFYSFLFVELLIY